VNEHERIAGFSSFASVAQARLQHRPERFVLVQGDRTHPQMIVAQVATQETLEKARSGLSEAMRLRHPDIDGAERRAGAAFASEAEHVVGVERLAVRAEPHAVCETIRSSRGSIDQSRVGRRSLGFPVVISCLS
jgi:hypothetical protein